MLTKHEFQSGLVLVIFFSSSTCNTFQNEKRTINEKVEKSSNDEVEAHFFILFLNFVKLSVL